jgi:tRNA (guanine-N7-)-methyltransferase
MDIKNYQPIKSFSIRSGRMTQSQSHAFKNNFSKWGLASDKIIDFDSVFDKKNPLVLEIGFGMGDSLAEMAFKLQDKNFIGVEVHTPGIGRLLSLIEKNHLTNLRVLNGDAKDILKNCIKPNSLSRINIYFPDPWHKNKHHKRRLIQSKFLNIIYTSLKKEGILHVATDWEHYAKSTLNLLENHDGFSNIVGKNQYICPSQFDRPETKFELRGRKLGHEIFDMVFIKN